METCCSSWRDIRRNADKLFSAVKVSGDSVCTTIIFDEVVSVEEGCQRMDERVIIPCIGKAPPGSGTSLPNSNTVLEIAPLVSSYPTTRFSSGGCVFVC